MTSPHKVLGVPQSATEQEIKTAYRQLALKYHPDLASGSDKAAAERAFKEVSEAYARLTGRTPLSDWQPAGRGYSYSSGGWQAARTSKRFSNAAVALIILAPLTFTGIFLGQQYSKIVEDSWRPHGMLQPPQNPWLREEDLATQRNRFWSTAPSSVGKDPAFGGNSECQPQEATPQAGSIHADP